MLRMTLRSSSRLLRSRALSRSSVGFDPPAVPVVRPDDAAVVAPAPAAPAAEPALPAEPAEAPDAPPADPAPPPPPAPPPEPPPDDWARAGPESVRARITTATRRIGSSFASQLRGLRRSSVP